jgi:hypothetical protein
MSSSSAAAKALAGKLTHCGGVKIAPVSEPRAFI